METRDEARRSIRRRRGRAVLQASATGLLITVMSAGAGFAQGVPPGDGSVNQWLRDSPSGSGKLTAGPNAGLDSEPPAGDPVPDPQAGGMAPGAGARGGMGPTGNGSGTSQPSR